MEQHIRYLELRLARGLTRPDLHRHQIEALNGQYEIPGVEKAK